MHYVKNLPSYRILAFFVAKVFLFIFTCKPIFLILFLIYQDLFFHFCYFSLKQSS